MAPSENPPTAHSPAASSPADAHHAGHGQQHEAPVARTGTIVWGLIAVVLGFGSMAVALGRGVDIEVALIFLFLLAGLGLLVGSVTSAAQRARRGRQRNARARS